MNHLPKVSVIVTAYNREKYISHTIDSVLKQTYHNFELIIVDDCSTDLTFEIAKHYVQLDTRIRLYRNEENLGQFANRNRAASLARTDLIKYLDSDDVLYPHALKIFVEAMEQYPEAVIGVECHINQQFQPQLPCLISGKEALMAHYTKASHVLYLGPSGCIFRKSCFDIVRGFKSDSGILNDTLLMLQLSEIGSIVLVQRDLFFWRVHNDQITTEQKNEFNMMKERFFINQSILLNSESILDAKHRIIIWRNLKKVYVRNIFRKFAIRGKMSKAISLLQFGNIKFSDILFAMQINLMSKLGKRNKF
jgi:glycosyltransferase involved in cell wall biosynthesis